MSVALTDHHHGHDSLDGVGYLPASQQKLGKSSEFLDECLLTVKSIEVVGRAATGGREGSYRRRGGQLQAAAMNI